MDGTDYNRPRRPNADTLTYLKSLPFDETIAHEEVRAYVEYQQKIKGERPLSENHVDGQDQEVEYPQTLSAAISALDEIKNEIASLAGDEFGSKCIEIIARIAAPYSTLVTRKLLHGISGYMIHLSTHRYGSHVVQTILQSTLLINEDQQNVSKILELDEDEEETSGNELATLKDIILNISEEIQPFSKDLAVHICGSHVLRSLLCILSGCVEVVPQHMANKTGAQRGKIKAKKKKKKKKSMATVEQSEMANNASYSQYKLAKNSCIDSKDENIQKYLYSIVYELTHLDLHGDGNEIQDPPSEPGELQQLACNPSAGPLLIVLLRLLTLKEHGSTDDVNEKKTEIETDAEKANKSISNFRLGIHSKELLFSSSSFAERLAKLLLCWDDKAKDQPYAGDIIYGLSGETRGSHLLEVLLRTSNDLFYAEICKAGKFFDNESFAEYAKHDVSNFVMQTLLNTARTREQVESLIKCVDEIISSGYALDVKNQRRGLVWKAAEMAAKFRIGQETFLKYLKKGFGALKADGAFALEDCIPELINITRPEHEGGRLILDATGARTVYQLLRFVPRLCDGVLSGIITKYDSDDFEYMCNDGLASRCIIDGILDGPTGQKPFSKAVKKMYQKLQGKWVALSVERVGQHTVKKIFIKLQSMEDRLSLSEELAQGIHKLDTNAMGRSVISECAVRDYMEGEEVWNNAVKKLLEKESFLKDIIEGNLGGSEKKRKRKRKKTNKVDNENEESTAMKKSKE